MRVLVSSRRRRESPVPRAPRAFWHPKEVAPLPGGSPGPPSTPTPHLWSTRGPQQPPSLSDGVTTVSALRFLIHDGQPEAESLSRRPGGLTGGPALAFCPDGRHPPPSPPPPSPAVLLRGTPPSPAPLPLSPVPASGSLGLAGLEPSPSATFPPGGGVLCNWVSLRCASLTAGGSVATLAPSPNWRGP